MMMGGGHLTQAEIDKVTKAMKDNEDALIAGILAGLDDKGEPANDKYIGTRLLEVDDSDYDIVRAMYRTAGLPEFDIQE
jgi:phosphonate transport system substrate-binding protein